MTFPDLKSIDKSASKNVHQSRKNPLKSIHIQIDARQRWRLLATIVKLCVSLLFDTLSLIYGWGLYSPTVCVCVYIATHTHTSPTDDTRANGSI